MTATKTPSLARILMIGHIFYPDEVRLRREAEVLARRGYDVTVLSLRRPHEGLRDIVNGVKIYRVPLTKKRGSKQRYIFEFLAYFLIVFLLVPIMQIRQRYKVVQMYNQPDFLIFALMIPKLLGARIVFDYRDAMPETFICKYGLSMQHPFIRFLLLMERAGLTLSDRVTTVHEPFRQQAIERGARPENVSIFLNFPDPHLFRRTTPPTHPRDPNVKLHLMYHGTIAERFGLPTALRAVALLRDRIEGLRFTIYGEGDGVPEIRRLLEELQLAGVAEYGGGVPLSSMPAYVAMADVGLVPVPRDIAQDKALSTKIMEYMMMGKPVIASWRPILEQYLDPASILYFEDGNAEQLAECILTLWQHPERTQILVQAADIFLQRHTWDKIVAAYVQMIDDLCGSATA